MSRFVFTLQHRDALRLDVMCRMLDVTRSGYFAWRGRPIGPRAAQNQQLSTEIVGIHVRRKGRYGVPWVHAELRTRRTSCSRRRVARLMRQVDLRGKTRRQYKTTTRRDPTTSSAPDLVQRNFTAPASNLVWTADITYLATRDGWLHLAVMLNLHALLVAGWALSERLTKDLPLAALLMAFQRRPQ